MGVRERCSARGVVVAFELANDKEGETHFDVNVALRSGRSIYDAVAGGSSRARRLDHILQWTVVTCS